VISVLIVDDNPIVRSALRGILQATDEVGAVAEAADGHQALAVARRLQPTVSLLDYRMPVADGLSVIGELSRNTNVLVLTSDADPDLIAGMLRRGARGYLVHGEFDPSELRRAVLAVADGQGWLSPVAAAVATATVRDQAAREQAERERTEWQRQVQARYGLTQREEEVLALLSEGLSNAAIGRRLTLTEKTVKNHLYRIFEKLQVSSRSEAVLRWTGQR
jgi:DNA-binding NarL/FixJ family response regulator